jgi:hypothetical protein
MNTEDIKKLIQKYYTCNPGNYEVNIFSPEKTEINGKYTPDNINVYDSEGNIVEDNLDTVVVINRFFDTLSQIKMDSPREKFTIVLPE